MVHVGSKIANTKLQTRHFEISNSKTLCSYEGGIMIIDATKIDYFQNPPRSSYDALISVFKSNRKQKNKSKIIKKYLSTKNKTKKRKSNHG